MGVRAQGVSASASRYEDYSTLIRSKGDGDSLKETVADLESRMGVIKSDIQTLQNQVAGNAFTAESLLATGAQKSEGSSLESRTVALENEVEDARTSVSSIEQVV